MTDLSATDSKIARYTRFHGLFKKEILQILRDPSSWIIALVLPVFLLFLFGYGVSLDASHVRLGVLVESPTPETREFTSALEFSGFFRLHPAHSRAPLEADLVSGQLDGMVILAQDFNARLLRGETAPIQLITDGSDPNTAGLVAGYVQGVWQTWLQQRANQQGVELSMPIRLEPRVWFNPEAKSRHFLVPGVIALIQMLIGTLLIAPFAIYEWQWPTAMQWLYLLAIGSTGALSQYWWILAFKAGEASVVAPFDYLRLLFAGLIGFIIFGELPDHWTLIGSAMIIGSTVYIAQREARRKKVKAG